MLHDLLGLGGKFSPKFVKQYADLHGVITQAVRAYIEDVQGGAFPRDEHSFH